MHNYENRLEADECHVKIIVLSRWVRADIAIKQRRSKIFHLVRLRQEALGFFNIASGILWDGVWKLWKP